MLDQQVIEFDWRGLEPAGRACTPITAYFHVKTKISQKNFRVDY